MCQVTNAGFPEIDKGYLQVSSYQVKHISVLDMKKFKINLE